MAPREHGGQRDVPADGTHFCVNDMGAMTVALREGAGKGLLAGFSAIEDLRNGTLVRVLPDYRTYSRNVYAVYFVLSGRGRQDQAVCRRAEIPSR